MILAAAGEREDCLRVHGHAPPTTIEQITSSDEDDSQQ